MRRIRLFIILASLLTCTLLVTIYFWKNLTGEPKLRIDFNPSPPWQMGAGQHLELNITITNEGNSPAESVNITLTAPHGFTILQSGTHKYSRNLAKLGVGEKQSITLTVTSIITPGNYTITTIIFAENVPEKSFHHQITVELPYIP